VKRILGLLGWIGVVLVVAAVVIRFAKPEWQDWSQRLALAGLVVTIIYGLSQWRDIARSFGGKNARYGLMSLGTVLVFLAVLVGLNWLSNRENKRWDLTGAKQFSLSDQTKKILRDLKKPVAVKVFYETGMDRDYRDRLGEYANESKQLTVEYIDAERNPTQAKQFQVQQYGTVVFEYDGRTERATTSQEQDLTNALIKVVEGKSKKIYFVQGHGEKDTVGSDRGGYSSVAAALKNDNFDVGKLALAQEGKVPDDATVLVVAGPKIDFLAPEVEAIRAYLKKGGKLLLLLDPPEPPVKGRAEVPPLTNLVAFAREWNIDVGNNIVLDTSGVGRMFGLDAGVPIAMPAQNGHAITRDFQMATGFPFARSVAPVEGATDKVAQKIVETSAKSWAETDLKSLFSGVQPALNADKGDKPGPVSIAAAVSAAAPDAPPAAPDAPKPETRVVVVGDADFASNGFIAFQGNKDLVLNIANWLAQEENLIAIRPRDPQDRRITLTQDQGDRIKWFVLLVAPGLLLAYGVRVWWRRR
jgi:ABC-type uncharacterized transport system involved in gliding motility auxiliary subunit